MMSNKPSTKINDLIREHIWEDHKECDNWEEAVDMVFSSYKFIIKMSKSEKAEYLMFWFNIFVEELQEDMCNEFMLDAVITKFNNWCNSIIENEDYVENTRTDMMQFTKTKLNIIKTL